MGGCLLGCFPRPARAFIVISDSSGGFLKTVSPGGSQDVDGEIRG